ncbi:MAG TPA: MATE family efflux transporter [Fluviicola sp.]|nr:MATE family efflux transporter [Fluviicola sp.]
MLEIRYSSILRVALPMMLSGFIQSIISISDAAFLGHYSTLAYDASGSAGLWYITLHMVFVGLSDGSQIVMAQNIGKKNSTGVASAFQSNFVLLVISAILLTCFVHFLMPQFLKYMVTNKELAAAELSFLEIRSYAFWATTIGLTVQAAYLATGKTTLVLFGALIVAVSNIILGYLLVFGIGPFPEMGLQGAALASTLAEILGMLFLLGTLLYGKLKNVYPFWKAIVVNMQQLKENLRVGIPLLFQGLVALSVWTVFFIWIEQMGTNELTVSLNIRYLYFLAFIPIWGFAGATKTYIAQYIGAKDYKALPVIQRRIQLLTVVFLVVTFHGAILYPETLIRLVNKHPDQIRESAQILRIISGSIIIYGLGSVYFQTISGSGNTRVTFIVECIATLFYLTAAYLLIKVAEAPLHLVWLVEYVYFITMGVVSLGYLRLFNWTKEIKAT